ncbi:hypothetical protein Erwinia_phage_Rouille_00082 [Erwinia phage Rouille]|uniref:Uncharacterized protein n=4 Tax=Caudoviricetes TaxID=2731619 RepID=A0A346FHZ6_9CAUD|nr:hypothetical protein SUNLIREN_126 [Erwinia phage SunLIRen]AYD79537.1 hypothetical protein LINGLNFE_00029 [Enterobacter phage phi63_307]UNA01046.1 hypothetical protein 1Hena2_00096 [Erwinia phage Hena2]UXD79787.1 hypothetical protein 4Roscha1_00097 [Erwinia phage Roscha1]WJN64838.1 hypothetical protein Erwinia_phage_Rouille_00082 [Erwinia phage Rouille]WNA13663.1 hypothetical protein FIfi106_00016 [Erwinia phage FIfi106]
MNKTILAVMVPLLIQYQILSNKFKAQLEAK